eukprot:1701409-Alexandrium_andersonii.AAC.1
MSLPARPSRSTRSTLFWPSSPRSTLPGRALDRTFGPLIQRSAFRNPDRQLLFGKPQVPNQHPYSWLLDTRVQELRLESQAC